MVDENELIGESCSCEELAARMKEAEARMRAARGLLDMENRGSFSGRDSFRRVVDMSRNPGRAHTLRAHFVSGTAAYEIVGKCESVIKKYPRDDWFFFMAIEKLRATCYKGDPREKVSLSRQSFFNAMALLRRLGGISPRLERDSREGYILPPHEALCVESEDAKTCTWIGPTFFNRKKRGLVGQFSMTPEGWIWHP
jgi:hypothetical protein